MKLQIVFKFILLCLILIFFKMGCKSASFTSGILYIHQEDYPKAIINLEKEISQNPTNAEALYLLGSCYAKEKRFEDMNKTFLSCLKISKLYMDQIADVRANCWFDPFNNGLQKLQDDQVHGAIKDFKMAILIDSNAVDAHKNLAAAQLNIEDYDAVLESYKIIARLEPLNPWNLLNLGVLYIKMARFPEAIEVLNNLLKIDPGNKQGIVNLSNAHAQTGDQNTAIKIYDKVISKNSRDPDFYFNRGKLHFWENDFVLAANDFVKVVEFEPEDFETLFLLGVSYFNMGEKKRDKRIKLNDSNGDKNKIKELKDAELEHFKKAREQFEKAKIINPDNSNLWQNLGKNFIRLAMPDEAKAAFEKAEALKVKNDS